MFSCCVLLLFIFCMFESYPENKKRDKHKSAQSSKPPEANKNRSQQIAVYFYLCLPFWVWCLWLIVTFAFSANARTIAFVCVFSVYVYLFVIFLLRFFFSFAFSFQCFSFILWYLSIYSARFFFSLFLSRRSYLRTHFGKHWLLANKIVHSYDYAQCTQNTEEKSREKTAAEQTNERMQSAFAITIAIAILYVIRTLFLRPLLSSMQTTVRSLVPRPQLLLHALHSSVIHL